MHNQHNGSSFSFLVGFIMAIGNHLFGWMNQIQPVAHMNTYLQALLVGIVGAIGTFIGNEGLKFIKKQFKKKHDEHIY